MISAGGTGLHMRLLADYTLDSCVAPGPCLCADYNVRLGGALEKVLGVEASDLQLRQVGP